MIGVRRLTAFMFVLALFIGVGNQAFAGDSDCNDPECNKHEVTGTEMLDPALLACDDWECYLPDPLEGALACGDPDCYQPGTPTSPVDEDGYLPSTAITSVTWSDIAPNGKEKEARLKPPGKDDSMLSCTVDHTIDLLVFKTDRETQGRLSERR